MIDPTHAVPEPSRLNVPQAFAAQFDLAFDTGDARLLDLYARGKTRQWDAAERIDWSQSLDFENPMQLPVEALPIHRSRVFARMGPADRIAVMREYQAWTTSQFLHGEQGAMVCAARTVQQVPSLDAKLFAATQVVDEARHVEAYQRLAGKFGAVRTMTDGLARLLGQVLEDSRWDMTYLGMQVVIEGLALAAFARIRDAAQNPLAAAVNAFVMEDEARHVAFGSLSLRDYYPQLTQAERDEREDFLIEACALMRTRFAATELWQKLDLPLADCAATVDGAPNRADDYLFSRIVPTIRSIGLFGPRIRRALAAMGVLHLAAADPATLCAGDEATAADFDARRNHIAEVAAAAG